MARTGAEVQSICLPAGRAEPVKQNVLVSGAQGGTIGGMQRIQVIDSHTGGEPTRLVIGGAPDLGRGTVPERAEVFRMEHDGFRSAVVCEPRGSDVLVGALLLKPSDPSCVAAVIFFNNVGVLGMCGHGTIGLVATLAHLGWIKAGVHRIETVVGVVTVTLHEDGRVSVVNVPSFRRMRDLKVTLGDGRTVAGDVAWGGNWFFLLEQHGLALELVNIGALTEFAWQVRRALNAQGHPEVDHVELFGAPRGVGADSRNFVLCPGGAYDRSPCGTGTSAKLACLAADGKLAEGGNWIQESIIGSRFTGSFHWEDKAAGRVVPTITGTAFITAESTLLVQEGDPFSRGIGA
jgi:4-hydroxyproline epimerase